MGWPWSRKAEPSAAEARREAHIAQLEQQARRLLAEAVGWSGPQPVDLRDAYSYPDGAQGGDYWGLGWLYGKPYTTQIELIEIQRRCRRLLLDNEYAWSAHENRINYIVGWGHTYQVKARDVTNKGRDGVTVKVRADDAVAAKGQAILDDWLRTAKWGERQQETMVRVDSYGECFRRLFRKRKEENLLAVRFVESECVYEPPGSPTTREYSFGVQTKPDDVETVVAYWVDGVSVPASEMQHWKANVTSDMKRGFPLLEPVRKNMVRAAKVARNMATIAAIQAAIAMIRKFKGASESGVSSLLASQSSGTRTNPASGKTEQRQEFKDGTILNVSENVDYEFPTAGVNAAALVEVVQSDLRAIASRLVMPEAMLSQDASNGNRASAMVAEDPSTKNFLRWQQSMIAHDLPIMQVVLDRARDEGILTDAERAQLYVCAEGPTVVTRDPLKDAQASEVQYKNRIKSRQTWQMEAGLNGKNEDENFETDEANGITPPGSGAAGAGVQGLYDAPPPGGAKTPGGPIDDAPADDGVPDPLSKADDAKAGA